MNRSSSLSVHLVAWISLIAFASFVVADEGPGCSRYDVHGISPGMSNRLVWVAMDGKGDAQSFVSGSFGQHSTARYDRNAGAVYIEYDAAISRRSDARVVSIETSVQEDSLDTADFARTLVESLGPPTTGGENQESGLRQGPAQWIDEACDIQVTASRRLPEWWQPSKHAAIHVVVQSLTFARSGAFPGEVDETLAADTSLANPFDPGTPEEALSAPSGNRQMAVETTPAAFSSPESQTSTQPQMASLSLGPTEQPASDASNGLAAPEPTTSESDPETEAYGVDPAPESLPHVAGVGGVTEPERLPRYAFKPRLPAAAKLQDAGGQVVLQALVLKDGTVGEVELLHVSAPGLGLEQAAIQAIKKWRYKPAELDGQPVDALVNVFVAFD
jgi:TonB family protein